MDPVCEPAPFSIGVVAGFSPRFAQAEACGYQIKEGMVR